MTTDLSDPNFNNETAAGQALGIPHLEGWAVLPALWLYRRNQPRARQEAQARHVLLQS